MSFEELERTGGELSEAGADLLFSFRCAACGEEVTIDQPNLLPEDAIHAIDTCGATTKVREAGGWWIVGYKAEPADEGSDH